MNIDAIEFDVRRTKDNQLILIHDNHTGNISNKKLFIHGNTLDELQQLTLKDGNKITTLKHALELINGTKNIVLDIKDSNIYSEIIRLLKKYPTKTVSFTGHQVQQMSHLTKELPGTTFYVQSHISPFEVVHTAKRVRATGISINAWLMNPLTYHLAKRSGLLIRVYTVNHKYMMWFMKKLYPGIEVFTNHPHRYIQGKLISSD